MHGLSKLALTASAWLIEPLPPPV